MSELWALFAALSVALIALEAVCAGPPPGSPAAGGGPRRDLAIYGAVVAAVAIFAGATCWRAGPDAGLAFLSGWVLEQALSLDNLFVFLLIFRALAVPAVLQARVLRWGIAGAVVLRGAFVALGLTLVRRMDGVFYLFGAILVVSAVKVWVDFARGGHDAAGGATLVARLRRWLPLTENFYGGRFFAREAGRWRATPLLAALVAIEVGDLVFAIDSVPAVLSVTQEPLWVASSNLFAILGLRTLFRLLGGAAARLRYLEVGLGGILLFVGGKMLLHAVVELDAGVSLAVVVGLFAVAVVASLRRPLPELG